MEQTRHTGFVDMNGVSRIKHDLQRPGAGDDAQQDPVRQRTARGRPVEICIVGAGFAGLRCADVLLQQGFRVTILEARDCLGGRVAQSDHLGHLVDLGPNWIHGTDGNPMMELANETRTRLHAVAEIADIYDEDGELLDRAETAEYEHLLWEEGVIAAAFRHSNAHTDRIDPSRSLYDFIVEWAEDQFQDDPEADRDRKRKILRQMAWMWSFYVGSPVDRQSLKFFWLEEVIEGETPFVAGTYQKILERVAAPARAAATIRLGCEVVEISSAGDGRAASVRLADGTALSFDEVVVTAPLGWLQHNQAAFRPALPPRLSRAIDSISYGTLDKVYVTFPSAFWHKPSSAPSPAWFHFLHPSYAPEETNPQRWMHEALNLASLPAAHPTLLFYLAGPQSVRLADLVTSAPTAAERDARLRACFEPYYSRLPHYSAADPACTPRAVLATAWAADRLAGFGSYANFQVGLERGDEDIEVMRRGMPERRVWLAGEHTAPFVALGTSTGAYMSGERVAGRMARAYGQVKGEGPVGE